MKKIETFDLNITDVMRAYPVCEFSFTCPKCGKVLVDKYGPKHYSIEYPEVEGNVNLFWHCSECLSEYESTARILSIKIELEYDLDNIKKV